MFRVLSENGHLARRPWFKCLSYYQQGKDDSNKDFIQILLDSNQQLPRLFLRQCVEHGIINRR